MSVPAGQVRVRRVDGAGSAGAWLIEPAQPRSADASAADRWGQFAIRTFDTYPDTATLSITPRPTTVRISESHWRAEGPSGSPWFLNPRIADLVGFTITDTGNLAPAGDASAWIQAANARGLAHLWQQDGEPDRHAARPPAASQHSGSTPSSGIRVGIDAAWLMGGESGAQVFVIEMLLALAARPDIAGVVLLSDAGTVPARLRGLAKITGQSWAEAVSHPGHLVDVLHRPYQPDDQVNFERYRRVGRAVVLTVLDFIAYDIPAYHESARAWRRHRLWFDEQIELADGVFAISHAVARRTDWQFAGRLGLPAQGIELGTDHLDCEAGAQTMPPALSGMAEQPFLVVLGNDFAHKNRDFAVRVFAALCERGYRGHLVLAGFHLDCGSSFAYEMAGAGPHAARIARLAAVSATERNWLLTNADVVLYPTCAEGFGLIPFEAAALGTPTAFVSFGPLAETMPGVDACQSWSVAPFADLVERLIREPERQVATIRAAARRLTWTHHADQVVNGYRELLAHVPQGRRRALPGRSARALRATHDLVDRLTAAVERRARRVFRFQSA